MRRCGYSRRVKKKDARNVKSQAACGTAIDACRTVYILVVDSAEAARVHKEELAGWTWLLRCGDENFNPKPCLQSVAARWSAGGGGRAAAVQPGAGDAAISRRRPFHSVLVSRAPSPETVLAVWAGATT